MSMSKVPFDRCFYLVAKVSLRLNNMQNNVPHVVDNPPPSVFCSRERQ